MNTHITCTNCGATTRIVGSFGPLPRFYCQACYAARGLILAALCDMVLGEDATDRSDSALIRAVWQLVPTKSQYVHDAIDEVWRKQSAAYGWLEDGFGNYCSVICEQCQQHTMQVVRPGKFQCSECG